MTEFISRSYDQDEFEVIIKTDNKEHYKKAEYFSRKLIDHAKPQTNADRIRAMSDEELARKLVNASYRYDWKQDEDYWHFPNGTTKTNYKPKAIEAWLEWLKQPA